MKIKLYLDEVQRWDISLNDPTLPGMTVDLPEATVDRWLAAYADFLEVHKEISAVYRTEWDRQEKEKYDAIEQRVYGGGN